MSSKQWDKTPVSTWNWEMDEIFTNNNQRPTFRTYLNPPYYVRLCRNGDEFLYVISLILSPSYLNTLLMSKIDHCGRGPYCRRIDYHDRRELLKVVYDNKKIWKEKDLFEKNVEDWVYLFFFTYNFNYNFVSSRITIMTLFVNFLVP